VGAHRPHHSSAACQPVRDRGKEELRKRKNVVVGREGGVYRSEEGDLAAPLCLLLLMLRVQDAHRVERDFGGLQGVRWDRSHWCKQALRLGMLHLSSIDWGGHGVPGADITGFAIWLKCVQSSSLGGWSSELMCDSMAQRRPTPSDRNMQQQAHLRFAAATNGIKSRAQRQSPQR